MDQPIYFYDNYGNISILDEISGISDILRLDADYLPVFYIYVLMKDGSSIIKEKRDELLGKIGNRIGNMIVQKIIEALKKRINEMEEQICVE